MTPPKGLPAELLLAHAEGLRALARRLLRDAHEAEDALQETFLRALARPPRERERVEGWLATVLRSVAHKRLRGDQRRRARERACARPEAAPEGSERAELLRTVLEAVLALDPQQRDLVLDRYFEGLAPREIARRRGLSIDTVSSRLARARARLRERLERELGADGEWRSKLSALVGLPLVPAPLGALPAVLFYMSAHLKLGAAGAALLLAALGWYATRGPSAAPAAAPELAAAALAPSTVPALPPRAAEPAADERSALAAAPEATPAPAEARALPPYRHELRVRVLDGEDRPLAGAPVDVAPPGGRWNRAGRTDARGELALALRGFESTLELALSVRAPFGDARAVRRVTLAAGAPTAVTVGLPGAGRYQLVLNLAEEGGGASFTGYVVTGRSTGGGSEPPDLAAVGDAAAFVEPPRVAVEESAEPDGEIEHALSFTDVFELPSADGGGGGGIRLTFEGFETAPSTEPEAAAPAALARGLVRNGAGQPLAGARVEARDESGAMLIQTRTDAEGEYELAPPAAAERLVLSAGGGGQGVASAEWRPAVEPELRWNPVLDRGHELLGRLVDAAGAPLANWIVEVELDDAAEPWWDHARTAEDGRFALPNLPRRALRLLARPGDAPHALAGLALEGVWPDLAERELSLDAAALAPGSVRALVVGPDGQPRQGDVRVWQRSSGRCAWLEPSASEPGVQLAERLPAGDYELEAGDPELGYAELASFRLQPGEALDLGVLRLAGPATLALSLPEAERVELWRVDEAFEARALELDGAPSGPLVLRAGDYRLRARLGAGWLERAFRLEPGQELELPAPEAR